MYCLNFRILGGGGLSGLSMSLKSVQIYYNLKFIEYFGFYSLSHGFSSSWMPRLLQQLVCRMNALYWSTQEEQTQTRGILWICDVKLVCWLVVFNVPSTARSFRDGTPIYCPLRTWSLINTPFRPGFEPRAIAWHSITLPLRYAIIIEL